MNLRQQILVGLVIAALIPVLPSCATMDEWQERPERNSLPAVFRVSTLDVIQTQCPQTPGAIGCAVADERRGFCYVYIPNDAPTWLLAHELLHCAGFDLHGR